MTLWGKAQDEDVLVERGADAKSPTRDSEMCRCSEAHERLERIFSETIKMIGKTGVTFPILEQPLAMTDTLLILSPDGTIERVNSATEALLGYEDGELIGHRLSTVLKDDDFVLEPSRTSMAGPTEKNYLTKNGGECPMLLSVSAVHGPKGELEAFVCFARDISAQKKAQAHVQLLFHASPVGILVANANGNIGRVNPTLCKLFGYTNQELLGQPVELLISDLDLDMTNEKGMVGGHRAVMGRRKDGTELWLNVNLTVTTVETRPVVIAAIVDRTEACEADQKMRRLEMEAARAAGMSEVATGVLHNVGNVVNSVSVSTNLLSKSARGSSLELLEKVVSLVNEHDADPASLIRFVTEDVRGKRVFESIGAIAKKLKDEQSEMRREIESLQTHTAHIIAVVNSQQEFARSVVVLEEIELGHFLEQAITLSGIAFSSSGIRVKRRCGDNLMMTVNVHKLMQVVVNLLSNARHALVDNRQDDRTIEICSEEKDDGSIMITVSDNGIGIPPENLNRIFEYGFTTKPTGHGFGLHISAAAIRQLGGTLTAHSDGPGKGATFGLLWPAKQAREKHGTCAK